MPAKEDKYPLYIETKMRLSPQMRPSPQMRKTKKIKINKCDDGNIKISSFVIGFDLLNNLVD